MYGHLPCAAGEAWGGALLIEGAQTFGTPPAALARVHLPYK